MNLFVGQEERADTENGLWEQWGKETLEKTKRVALTHICYHMCKMQTANENCCKTQGAQLITL